MAETFADDPFPPIGPIRRALSLDELTTILDRGAAADVDDVLPAVAVAVYDTLLADLDLSLAALPEGQKVGPRNILIPVQQWDAIAGVVIDRVGVAGLGRLGLALDMVNVLPGTYDDPAAPVPELPGLSQRPEHLDVRLTREAAIVIDAAGQHLKDLADHYGAGSPRHLMAATSWLGGLTLLLTVSTGPQVQVTGYGKLSLVAQTGGYTFAVLFTGEVRRCITGDGCTALIADDGSVYSATPTQTVADHDHQPSYPVDAPRPGAWSVHS